jgi:hypothetical protein
MCLFAFSLAVSFQLWRDNSRHPNSSHSTLSSQPEAPYPSVQWGVRDPSAADLVFFNNFPWRSDLPCAGTWLVRTSPTALVRTTHLPPLSESLHRTLLATVTAHQIASIIMSLGPLYLAC